VAAAIAADQGKAGGMGPAAAAAAAAAVAVAARGVWDGFGGGGAQQQEMVADGVPLVSAALLAVGVWFCFGLSGQCIGAVISSSRRSWQMACLWSLLAGFTCVKFHFGSLRSLVQHLSSAWDGFGGGGAQQQEMVADGVPLVSCGWQYVLDLDWALA
jgi:hypothetical protein